MMMCSLSVALAEEVVMVPVDREIMIPRVYGVFDGMLIPSDASGVVEENGRLSGPVTSLRVLDYDGHPFLGDPAVSFIVDAPAPQDFTDEQRVIITAPAIAFSDEQLGAAMQSTGLRSWQIDEYVKKNVLNSGHVTAKALPATMDADKARENAKQVALDFLREAGVGGARVIHAMRPEDDAATWSLNVIPEQREAERARILREWHTSHRDYTWVHLEFTLHDLVALCEAIDDEGISNSSVANLYIGDAGEMREACVFCAPQETGATPYTGDLITWREALEIFAGEYGSSEENNAYPIIDERGRTASVIEHVITAIEPGYMSADGETYVPAWIITEQDRVVDSGELYFYPSVRAVDARVDR